MLEAFLSNCNLRFFSAGQASRKSVEGEHPSRPKVPMENPSSVYLLTTWWVVVRNALGQTGLDLCE